ncbi:MAG: amidase [Phycisphaerales bacterium]
MAHRVPDTDAVVVQRLNAQGAVLVAKLATGNRVRLWFGGQTRNPWDSSRGASGSSAGPASAVAAGCVSFAIGTETLGSIVSPCMECGTVGLRPTFGRVARTGCMALSWSMDKIGAIARSSRDVSLVLAAINGADVRDPSSRQQAFLADPSVAPGDAVAAGVEGLRVGVVRRWLEDPAAGAGADPDAAGAMATAKFDRDTIDRLRAAGATIVDVDVPEAPYQTLVLPLLVEGAAAFEELTRTNIDDQLSWQADEAWPNTFRRTWLVPAIELVQTERFRREVMATMREVMSGIDVLAAPSFAGGLAGPLMIGNTTGIPSITVPTNLRSDGRPHGITILGRLFDEGTLVRVGMAVEEAAPIRGKRPPSA